MKTANEVIAAIRTEIERRITDNTFGAKLELIDILAFLDDLPEQPVDIPSAGSGAMGTTPPKFKLEVKEQPVEGLEEAAEEYKNNHPTRAYWLEGEFIEEATPLNIAFKAGAQWRDAFILKLPDNLDEAASASMPKPNGIESNTDFSFMQMVWMFEQGAEWMAGQGVTIEAKFIKSRLRGHISLPVFFKDGEQFNNGEDVIVQIRKK